MTILWQENLSQKTEGHIQLNSSENKLHVSGEYGLGKTLKIHMTDTLPKTNKLQCSVSWHMYLKQCVTQSRMEILKEQSLDDGLLCSEFFMFCQQIYLYICAYIYI